MRIHATVSGHEWATITAVSGRFRTEFAQPTMLDVILGFIAGYASRDLWSAGRARLDRRRVYRWLRAHTANEADKRHAATLVIVQGTRMPEARVRSACQTDPRIHLIASAPDRWSIWRQEPDYQLMVVGPR
jgi:hypothetical protein